MSNRTDGGKDILLGAADLYTWNQIKPWALSIKESGFTGEVWLIAYRIDAETIATCESHGINVYKVEHDQYMRPIQHEAPGTPTQAHNLRFFHAWELLSRLWKEQEYKSNFYYHRVIMTDVRDVIFQSDPSLYLDHYIDNHTSAVIAPSENILFEHEAWNKNNVIASHGQIVYDMMLRDREACNVGTIAGSFNLMRDMCYVIYSLSQQRAYPADQSSYNVLVAGVYNDYVIRLGMNEGWAAQIGTSYDPTKAYLWEHNIEPRPIIANGMVYTNHRVSQPFVIVHQWDRNPTLKAYFSQKYGI